MESAAKYSQSILIFPQTELALWGPGGCGKGLVGGPALPPEECRSVLYVFYKDFGNLGLKMTNSPMVLPPAAGFPSHLQRKPRFFKVLAVS